MQQEQQQENTFICKIDNKILLNVISGYKDLLKEIRLNFNKEGLNICEIEPANVCLIECFIKNSDFIAYELNENLSLGINTLDVYNILKGNKKTYLNLYLNSEKTKLIFIFDNGFKNEISLITFDSEIKKIPELDFNCSLILSSKKLKEIVKNFSNISDRIVINLSDKVIFKTYSDLNNSEIDITEDSILNRKYGYTDIIKSIYSIEYLLKITKNLFSEKVILNLCSDYPIKISYVSGEFSINYILAPRIEQED